MRLDIGPPASPITTGMNTTFRRQQLPPTSFRMIRNLRISKEAFQRVQGKCRIIAANLPAASLSSSTAAPTRYVKIPYTDTAAITDYVFDTGKFTVFAAWRKDAAGDAMIVSHGTGADPAFRITHNTNNTITALVTDADAATATVSTTNTYTRGQVVCWLVRDRNTVSLYVNDDDPVQDTSTLGASNGNKSTTDDITMLGWNGHATGSAATLYEFRLFRTPETSKEWRLTQYPWTGRFGNPNLVCHLLFEEGTGTSLTDYSRVNNESIALQGAGWTWNATTLRQTIAPVTGIHEKENARGRKWLLVDVGKNHYRIPLN